ncbi:MAG: response regulator [Chloroflexi bacterium]|nr:response regulator [Chloroflexota bacterium]MBK6712364.1 response regulator [Chloroflexota bacterium]MBK7178986.1 response regulator [Chloroflexota bacterium]MBK7916976.1 response regulator [Chloroflexota bacterium]MBP6803113.1 response regulator [Chloroflexota bacterium]
MNTQINGNPVKILLVEDNPGDIRLTKEALREGKVNNEMFIVTDGLEALAFLNQKGQYANAPRPDVILLDLNLPLMNGAEVLANIKADPRLKRIPVIVLTTSDDERDILNSYDLHANAYVTKPVDLEHFIEIIGQIEGFWLTIVKLPPTNQI